MVTKMLASLLFKVGLEHVACLWQKKKKKKGLINTVPKKLPYPSSHSQSWETTCLVHGGQAYACKSWPRQQITMRIHSRQTDTSKRLSHIHAVSNWEVTPPLQRVGRGQREAKTRRLTHRVWFVSIYLFPCDKHKALRSRGCASITLAPVFSANADI